MHALPSLESATRDLSTPGGTAQSPHFPLHQEKLHPRPLAQSAVSLVRDAIGGQGN